MTDQMSIESRSIDALFRCMNSDEYDEVSVLVAKNELRRRYEEQQKRIEGLERDSKELRRLREIMTYPHSNVVLQIHWENYHAQKILTETAIAVSEPNELLYAVAWLWDALKHERKKQAEYDAALAKEKK